MKYLIFLLVLFTSCTSTRKSINQVTRDVTKSIRSQKDSIGRLSIDSTNTTTLTEWVMSTVDSGYDKITDEVVKDFGDSVIIVRTIKEKGQKRVEHLSSITRQDSASKKIEQQAAVNVVLKQDSSGVTFTTQKTVNRTSFLPWWVWLIVAGVVVLGWWKRNSIIELFT